MKFLFPLFSLTYLWAFPLKAQYYDTLYVLPGSPTVHDTITLNRDFTIYSIGTKVHDTLFRISDTIYLISCFRQGWQPSSKTFRDTFAIGKLPARKYVVKATTYYSFSITGCVPIDTVKKLLAFSVIDDIGLPEINNSKKINVELYPNPTSNLQKVSLHTQIPVPLQINLHDISGQKVIEVFDGLSVQGRQEFEVDLSQLPRGVYFYHIKAGEEWQYLKTVKQ